jgi:predicted Zn-dependent protease
MTNRLFIISLLLLAVNLYSGTCATAGSTLKGVQRSDESAHLQLLVACDQLPGFNLNTNGRRVDLELADTSLPPALPTVAADGRMIKMVSDQRGSKTVLSFYFRYPPQKVAAESHKETGTITIDVLLGNQLSASSPEFSTKLQGVSVIKRGETDSINPMNATPYAKNWPAFFLEYESPVAIKPAPVLHLPPFPLASGLAPKMPDDAWLSAEVSAQAGGGKWNQACRLLREQITTQPDEKLKERLVLAYAEALIRAGEYRDPYFLLQRIMLQYPDSTMADLAQFLLIYQQATRGDFINSYYELIELTKKTGPDASFSSAVKLLLAELALAAGRTTDAEKLLADPALIQDAAFASTRLLRQADLLYIKNDKVKALTAYLALASKPELIDNDPMSLAFFSDCLYTAKRYPEAAKHYAALADRLNNRPDQDLALFRATMSQLHVPATAKKARLDLQQIHEAFANTNGGTRALLKQTDLDFTGKNITAREAQAIYEKYAALADAIDLREEGKFKQALVNSLSGEHEASVQQCRELLRSFQSGKLRTEATALLIQQIPAVIRHLVKNKEYVMALALAKQNKKFFARRWIDSTVLYDLAGVYDNLGMADQAAQTYQYLFEVADDGDKEKIYLPLLRSLFSAARYVQVEEYADRYQLRYPKGSDLTAVFFLKARAFYESGQLDKAIKILTAANSPKLPQLELLKGRIFSETNQWQKVIDTLAAPALREMVVQNGLLLSLAEAYFQTGQEQLATPLFQQLAAATEGGEQAQYRLAQIELHKNNAKQALNLFKELAEKGKDPLWTKLAREEAAILGMRQ